MLLEYQKWKKRRVTGRSFDKKMIEKLTDFIKDCQRIYGSEQTSNEIKIKEISAKTKFPLNCLKLN